MAHPISKHLLIVTHAKRETIRGDCWSQVRTADQARESARGWLENASRMSRRWSRWSEHGRGGNWIRIRLGWPRQYLAMGLVPGDRVASLLPNRGALARSLSGLLQSRACGDAAQLSLSGPGDRSCAGGQRGVAVVAHAERDDVLAASQLVPRLPLGRISYEAEGWCAIAILKS